MRHNRLRQADFDAAFAAHFPEVEELRIKLNEEAQQFEGWPRHLKVPEALIWFVRGRCEVDDEGRFDVDKQDVINEVMQLMQNHLNESVYEQRTVI